MTNRGTTSVMFSVGTKSPGLNDLFGFRTTLKPGAHRTLLLYLSRRGRVPYYVGDSYGAAASTKKGQLVIGDTCTLCAPPGPPLPP